MDKLPSHRILQYNPDTFEFVRKEHGLDKPGQMDAAIDLLDDWIKKQAHFTKKEFSREYLERTITLGKGSVERAKSQLDKLFTMRTMDSKFFEKPDPHHKHYEILHEYFVDALLPKLTKDHYRIYAAKIIKDGDSPEVLSYSFQFGAMIFEHIRHNDYYAGFIGILDYRDRNIMDIVANINIIEAHQFILFITEGYQMRVKGIHILTNSKAIDLIVRILKQAFSKKIGERIFVHMTEESLHKHLPKELLPKEFGGELKPLVEQNKDWVEELSRKENISVFKKMGEAKVNESLRTGNTNGNTDLLGISGSFRTLNIV